MALYTKIKGDASYVEMGSPTILDGIISGFSTSNYLKLPTFAPGNKSWELKLKFLSNNAGITQAIVRLNTGTGNYGGMLIGMNANNRLWWNIGSSGTSWFQTNPTIDPVLTNNTWYEILVKYDGSKYTLSIINNGVATVAYTNNTATPIYQQGDTTIGARVTGTTNYFRGSVDLNNTYIKIENTVWFGTSFSKVKVNTGLIKYTVVGSPTISNGIASGFSSSNYLQLQQPFKLNANTIAEFKFKFKITTASTANGIIGYPNGYGFHFIVPSDNKVDLFIGNGSSWTILNGQKGTTVLSANTDYYIKININKGNVVCSLSTDDINYNTEFDVDITLTEEYTYNLVYGRARANSQYLRGSIDLNASYIKIGDGYYWRGSHQNINAWKIQQDNFSKYYTIVDGKLMWASPDIYLESSGTQWISTGLSLNLNDTINMNINISDINNTGNCYIFESGTDSSRNRKGLSIYKGGSGSSSLYYNYTYSSYSSGYTVSYNEKLHIKTILENENYNYYVNGVLKKSVTSVSDIATNNDLTFFNTLSSVKNFPINAKLYNFKVSNNTNTVTKYHFVPVPKGLLIGNFVVPSNGMFDIVNQQFYGNSGTGEFEIGGIPEDYIIEGGKLIWSNPDIYLESSGTQWISTGIDIYQTTNHKLCFDFIPTEFYNYNSLFGVTSDANDWEGWIYSNGQLAARYNNTRYASDIGITVNTRNYVEYIKNGSNLKRVLNGTETATTSVTTSSRTGITIIYHSGPDYSKLKIFSFKLFTDTLQQYLVPVPKGMLIGDKIAPSNCMFDMVTQTFFENQGTGTFVIDGLSGDYIDIGDNIVWVDNNVYLKCNGAQYFDSDFKANQDTKVDVDYTPIESGVMTVYCCRDGLRSNTFTCFSPVSGTSSTRYDYNTTQNTISSNPVAGTRRHIVADKNKFYIDDVLKYTATYSNFQANNTMIFGCSNANGYDNYSKFKYHKIQLYNNSKLIRYFLPVNTNTTIGSFTVPAPGMWDAVTKKFYPNKGTGAFTYGKDS